MKMKQNWNVRNSFSHVPTATKIRFHFQFPRSPDATFGGRIGWLLNWKFEFGCMIIISNIANFVKYNSFWDDDEIDNIMLWFLKLSYFCSRHIVGVADDDIMYHILVGLFIHGFDFSTIGFEIGITLTLSPSAWPDNMCIFYLICVISQNQVCGHCQFLIEEQNITVSYSPSLITPTQKLAENVRLWCCVSGSQQTLYRVVVHIDYCENIFWHLLLWVHVNKQLIPVKVSGYYCKWIWN